MANILYVIKSYAKRLTDEKIKYLMNQFYEVTKELGNNDLAADDWIHGFCIEGLLADFPMQDGGVELTPEIRKTAEFIAERLRDEYSSTSQFFRGGPAQDLLDLEAFFVFVKNFYPMDEDLYNVLTVKLEDDETDNGGLAFAGETVGHFLMGDGPKIHTIRELNDELISCGIKPIFTEKSDIVYVLNYVPDDEEDDSYHATIFRSLDDAKAKLLSIVDTHRKNGGDKVSVDLYDNIEKCYIDHEFYGIKLYITKQEIL